MQINNILKASLLDIIFDGRNKAYGAYELRVTYPQRIKRAMLFTFTALALIIGGTVLAGASKRNSQRYQIGNEQTITDIAEKKKEEKLPEPPPKKQEEPQVKTEKLTVMDIKPDEEVKAPPPSQDDLSNAKIGDLKVDGVEDPGLAGPNEVGEGIKTGIIEEKVEKENEEPLAIVEVDAKFIGNWAGFLLRNLNPDVPAENNAPEGRYSVVIRFVVDKEGNVSDITPLTNHGYGMEQEAVRVLRKATKWEPAIQNGYKVKAYHKQTVVFEVMGAE